VIVLPIPAPQLGFAWSATTRGLQGGGTRGENPGFQTTIPASAMHQIHSAAAAPFGGCLVKWRPTSLGIAGIKHYIDRNRVDSVAGGPAAASKVDMVISTDHDLNARAL